MRPSDRPLRIQVVPREDGVVVELSGSATMEWCAELSDRLLEVAAQSPSVLAIDMADLDFIGSLGLGSVVAAYLRARRHGGRFALCRPRREIAEVLEVTKLNTLLSVYESVEEALAPV